MFGNTVVSDPGRPKAVCSKDLSGAQVNGASAAFITDDDFYGDSLFNSYSFTDFINIGFSPRLRIVQKNSVVPSNSTPFFILNLYIGMAIREVPKYKQCARKGISSDTSKPYQIATFPKLVISDSSQLSEPINFGDDGKPPRKPNLYVKREPDDKHDEEEMVRIAIIMDRVKQIVDGYSEAAIYLREYLDAISLSQKAIELLKLDPDFIKVNEKHRFL